MKPVIVSTVAEVADILQIPAFLCRQTDLIAAAALSERVVNIKKGQFLLARGHEARRRQVPRFRQQASFRHRTRPKLRLQQPGGRYALLAIMRKFAPVVFDATHSVQPPSASRLESEDGNATSGGQPEFIPVLSRAAVAAGVDGVFMEVHDNPKEAKSDGANALDSQQTARRVERIAGGSEGSGESPHYTP